ncbi:hypothetical protein JL721_10665 [Aureococcus anophagefferens]|nr:hypothetical protein JL721_10665 [Aureococcus anophagefferens]
MSLAEARALLGLRVALVACADGRCDGRTRPTASGPPAGFARIEAARTARLRALASLRRLRGPRPRRSTAPRAFLDEGDGRWRPRRPRRSRRSAGATRRLPRRRALRLGGRVAPRAPAPPPTLDLTRRALLPLPPAPGPPPPPPPPGRDMDDADWCDAWGFVADDARRKRLYDEVLVRSATVSDLPDDGPLRRLEAADDGGDGRRAAKGPRPPLSQRCVVALRRAAARGAWEASDDPADALSPTRSTRLEGALTRRAPRAAAGRDAARELKRAEDELARRAGSAPAADRAADLLRYAYAEFRDAGSTGARARRGQPLADAGAAGQLREARAFARELRFDCARAWDAATRGLAAKRSAVASAAATATRETAAMGIRPV